MKRLLLAGMLALATPAFADEFPEAITGEWQAEDDAVFARTTDESASDFSIQKDRYFVVDFECIVLHVEKQDENTYIVQARCSYEGGDNLIEPYITTNEFAIKRDKLHITPVTGS